MFEIAACIFEIVFFGGQVCVCVCGVDVTISCLPRQPDLN